jgi:hypothetical protein
MHGYVIRTIGGWSFHLHGSLGTYNMAVVLFVLHNGVATTTTKCTYYRMQILEKIGLEKE